jgi:hypothetical protein
MEALIEHLLTTKYLFGSIVFIYQIVMTYALVKAIMLIKNVQSSCVELQNSTVAMKDYFQSEIRLVRSDIEKNERKYDEMSKVVYVVQGQMGINNGK